ncbi:MAG: MFS transporter [Rhodospirillales bacterium]|nr:MFS transporter [Rhodospirillales bacterium]
MTSDMQHLMLSRRFLPLFVTQFLGAANDNLFKSALVMLITFDLAERVGLNGPLMVTVAAGIFIAPFFLFSAWSGQVADRFDKAVIAKVVKFAEIVIMGAAALAFWVADPWILMAVLFLMGAQSTVFGPVKYSILPQHLGNDELISANALIEAGTFLAILIGTIVGGLLVLTDNGITIVSALVVGIAVLGFATSLFIPPAPGAGDAIKLNINVFAGTVGMLFHAAKQRDVFLSILGISWFWLVGATFISQFPTFAKVNLGGDEGVVTLFLSIFSIGVGIGSALCSKVLKGEITAKYVPFAALAMTVFMVDLYFASGLVGLNGGVSAAAFLATPIGLRIVVDLLMIAISGGLYIVPLYAILQSRGDEAYRARDIAANNIYNALFMVVSALVVALLLAGGLSVPGIFLCVAIANLGAAVLVMKLRR